VSGGNVGGAAVVVGLFVVGMLVVVLVDVVLDVVLEIVVVVVVVVVVVAGVVVVVATTVADSDVLVGAGASAALDEQAAIVSATITDAARRPPRRITRG
jgi:hypothetical protein